MTQLTSEMHLVPLADVHAEPVRWLWPRYLPLGKLVVVDGLPGHGKSTLLMDVAARLSQGREMPDGSLAEVHGLADSVFLTYEDDAGDTLKPRLLAAGGDEFRVHHVRGVTRSDDPAVVVPPTLPEDLDSLERSIRARSNVRLIVIDPMSAALGGQSDVYTEIGVRRVLSRLGNLARECGACVVLVRHLRKDRASDALAAGLGSMGIIAQARVSFVVGQHPEEDDATVIAMTKNNLAAAAPSLAFRKVPATATSDDGRTIATLKLEWMGAVPHGAEELLKGRAVGDGGEMSAAEQWLKALLTDGAEMERREVIDAAAGAGFSERTLDRAAASLRVTKRTEGFGAERRSFWLLHASSRVDTAVPTNPANAGVSPGLAEMADLDLTPAPEKAA